MQLWLPAKEFGKRRLMPSSNKAQDPTAAALLAIEEALHLRAVAESTNFAESSAGAVSANRGKEGLRSERESAASKADALRQSRDRDTARPLEPRPTAINEDRLFGSRVENFGATGAEIDSAGPSGALSPPVRAANDDRRSAGEILRSIQGRYDGIPAALVAACSALWIILAVGYVIANRAALFDLPAGALLPQATLYLMAITGPVVFLVLSAALLRRGQEMRLAARSMTDVAIHLAEPETIATEQIVPLSQPTRRAAASMGDGIERALARASELETLVRSEVSNLERSYSDNERRIRAL